MTSTVKVLMVGVGSMGAGMGLHLASKSSYEVLAFDAHKPTMDRFTSAYEEASINKSLLDKQRSIASIKDLVNPFSGAPDVVIFMVVNSDQIHEILFTVVGDNNESYLSTLTSQTTILIMSTCSPSSVLEINEKIRQSKIYQDFPVLIDAPVSGGPIKARAGIMSIMMSAQGKSSQDGKDLPYLQVLKSLSSDGATLYAIPKLKFSEHEIGSGSMAKALHQLLAGVHIATAAEVLSLANATGIDLKSFYELVTGGAAGNSWMFGDRGKRMIGSMLDEEVEIKSRVTIFIKDLGIIMNEASRLSKSNDVCATPLAKQALSAFQAGVKMGFSDSDDSSLWKVYDSLLKGHDPNSGEAAAEAFESESQLPDDVVFAPMNVVEVGDEPYHRVKLVNSYTRVLLVQFDEGKTTLAHTHSHDSVYLFLSPNGVHVKNRVRTVGCLTDFMEFGEVRYGYHCKCPLTHRIHAVVGGGGVLCVDAEVLAPPPDYCKDAPEVEELPGHTLVKTREKARVFLLVLKPGESAVLNYAFFHLMVVSEASLIEASVGGAGGAGGAGAGGGVWVEEKKVGDCEWGAPLFGKTVKNVGSTQYGCYVIQWRASGWVE